MRTARLRVPLAAAVAAAMTISSMLMSSLPTPAARAASEPAAALAASNAPNIVLVTTDDQAMLDLEHMPKTRRLLAGLGVEFTNALSPHPLCCPARAEILTGQFAQNNGVRTNQGAFGAQALVEPSNVLPVWLQDAGYRTAFLGKWLNGYETSDPGSYPAGWDSWNASYRGIYDYKRFTLNHNGALQQYRGRTQADVYADITGEVITELAGDRPFFIWQSQLAPHGQEVDDRWVPPSASRRNTGTFANQPLLSASSPSYDERDVSDKPIAIRKLEPITDRRHHQLTRRYQARLESLQDVDDAVATLVRDLKAAGEYRDTLIVFTSDNGYLMGEHRYVGKVFSYEESLRVPLLLAGARVPSGAVRQQTVTLVDVAPTILAAAGVAAGRAQDGQSLLPAARSSASTGWETVLVQAGPSDRVDGGDAALPQPAIEAAEDTNWLYRGARTRRYTYARYPGSGEEELYDRVRDPWQLRNVAGDRDYAAVLAELAERTRQLSSCSGDCVRNWSPMPAPHRVQRESDSR